MCTTIGFSYKEGKVFGRTLEIGVSLENKIAYIPRGEESFLKSKDKTYRTKYAAIGTSFFDIASLGDGINEMGLMGSSNLFPGYASFAKEAVEGKKNMITSHAFDYLLTMCKDLDEVKEEAEKIVLLEHIGDKKNKSTEMHFFFMDPKGNKLVLEPKDGILKVYDNPYGVLTNSPEFFWHETNLKNYINLNPENVDEGNFNGEKLSKFGEGTGMMGLPGDFTPPSRFIRAAYFVSNTPKDMDRTDAILQTFRILSQSDIPTGAIKDSEDNTEDQTLYTGVMDSKEKAYYIKCHDNINLQSFRLNDYKDEKNIKFIDLKKDMEL